MQRAILFPATRMLPSLSQSWQKFVLKCNAYSINFCNCFCTYSRRDAQSSLLTNFLLTGSRREDGAALSKDTPLGPHTPLSASRLSVYYSKNIDSKESIMLIYRELAKRLHESVCNARAVSYFGAFTTHVSIEKLLFVSVECSKLSSQFHKRLKIDVASGPFFVVSPGRRYNTHEVMAVSLWVNQKYANTFLLILHLNYIKKIS